MTKYPHNMPTPAQKLNAQFKKLVEQFMKSPILVRVGFALAILAGLYTLLMLASPFSCLINLVAPLVFLGVLWKVKIQSIKQLLIVGLLGSLVVAGVYTDFATRYYLDIPAQAAESDDGVLHDGIVTPLYGTSDTIYNFTVSVDLPNTTSVVTNMTVVVGDLRFYGGMGHNYTMLLNVPESNETIAKYYYETTVPHPLNLFVFWASIDGEWYIAGNPEASPETPLPTFGIEGPAFKDYGALAGIMVPFGLYSGFVNIYPVYGILVLMIWWLKKARSMRIRSYEKAVSQREKEQAGIPKEDAKVPSLAKAMGVEGDDSFVCSECGADVPAEAKVCPKCGEKFD